MKGEEGVEDGQLANRRFDDSLDRVQVLWAGAGLTSCLAQQQAVAGRSAWHGCPAARLGCSWLGTGRGPLLPPLLLLALLLLCIDDDVVMVMCRICSCRHCVRRPLQFCAGRRQRPYLLRELRPGW